MPLQHSVKEVALKNGAKGLLVFVPGSTSIQYEFEFRAGTHYAKATDISQVAHVMEHMAFGQNSKYASSESFSRDFSRNGADSNAGTSTVQLTYIAYCGISEWDRILDMQCLSITSPVYTQVFLESEKSNVHEELEGYLDDDGRALNQEILRQSGLHRWFDQDELDTLPNITLDDVKEHFASTHTAQNMRFVIAGDLERHASSIVKTLEAWDLPAGRRLPLPIERIRPAPVVHLRRPGVHNLQFTLNFYVNRKLSLPEIRAAGVLIYVLTETLHSRIWGVARARGLSYGLNGWVDTHYSRITELGFSGEVSHANTEALFALMANVLKDVAVHGITEDELAEAKQYRRGALQMDFETVNSLVQWYSELYYEHEIIDTIEQYSDRIEATTLEDVRAIAAEFLTSPLWTLGGLGDFPEKTLKKYRESFAKAWANR